MDGWKWPALSYLGQTSTNKGAIDKEQNPGLVPSRSSGSVWGIWIGTPYRGSSAHCYIHCLAVFTFGTDECSAARNYETHVETSPNLGKIWQVYLGSSTTGSGTGPDVTVTSGRYFHGCPATLTLSFCIISLVKRVETANTPTLFIPSITLQLKLSAPWAQILVNDVPLEEHAVEVVNANTVRCYIASEVGQAFQVKFLNNLDQIVKNSVHLDGSKVASHIISSHEQGVLANIQVSQYSMSSMQFAALNVTDDDTLLRDSHMAWEKLGLVAIKIYRVKKLGPLRRFSAKHYKTELSGSRPVHERSKKAGCHCIGLGPKIRTKGSYTAYDRVEYTDKPDGPPFVEIEFRYRPKDLLQAQGIIPLELPEPVVPTPAAKGKKRKTEALDASDQIELQEELNAVKARLRASIREQEELLRHLDSLKNRAGGPSAKRVTREPALIRVPNPGDVIDLTD
ncbi:hypothetical protein K474DRAFT_1734946 [Panus rudis PR-1116 ss-1]|nr:hypothetical protein K474DRAFT_1734946 [Panus rudis PR-1116 ss-1]